MSSRNRTWPNGDFYIGGLKRETPHGFGTYVYFNSSRATYTGQFMDGHIHGNGTMDYADGDRYYGQWQDDLKEGYGEYYKSIPTADVGNRDREVQYLNNQKQDNGSMVNDGKWQITRQEGSGEPQPSNKCKSEPANIPLPAECFIWVYRGYWMDGKKYGKGRIIYQDSKGRMIYTGDWVEGKRHGHGTQIDDNGKYEGEWLYGKRNGRGTWTKPDGYRYTGDWVKDNKHGHGQETETDGATYTGTFQKDVKQGCGKFIAGRGAYYGDMYVGEFRDGHINGYGTYKWSDGRVYVGNHVNDTRQGYGILIHPSGRVVKGQWSNDNFKG